MRRYIEAFHRAKHRDRGGDHSVAIEQRSAEQTESNKAGAAPPLGAGRLSHEAQSARMPLSPLLSARMTKRMYLIEMMSVSDQKMSDSTPSTFSCVAATP